MKKRFTIFLILIFILGLVPVNFSLAITQNQINAEVQILCPDGYGKGKSGSGTIIDPRGIILTNLHVVEGAYKNICVIGFINSISQEPDFGTQDNYNLAEVKYYTTTDDMDTAILYLNTDNKIYPYVNIWDSNSDTLKFGDKIEVIGFPSVGGSTISYTSGDFSGLGSATNGTKNYIKTTAPLEHGNSGGASYNSKGQFIGIPTMVVPGELNSMSYILSVNSIKNWLSGFLGSGYKQEIIKQKPIITEPPKIELQSDITPPTLKNAPEDAIWLEIHSESSNDSDIQIINTVPIHNNSIKLDSKYRRVRLMFNPSFDAKSIDSESGYSKTLYNYRKDITPRDKAGRTLYPTSDTGFKYLTGIMNFPYEDGTYYIGLYFVDNAGNTSDRLIVRLQFGPDAISRDSNIDINFANKLKGYILLQTESKGEAWYVNPANGKRYYMRDGAAAYQMMRNFGLGITNSDLNKIPLENQKNNYLSLTNKLKGKILLQVQNHGEAWYVNPKTGYRHYMKDGNAAYSLMRYHSLGITDLDLQKIPEGGL